jgi:cell wall-associated NlpC family hydrolase
MKQALLLLLMLLMSNSVLASIRDEALLAVGTPYVRGGSSPDTGFDCSGLVTHVFRQAWGVDLPRSTRQQRWAGRPVRLAELRAGDLVFYNTRGRPYSHVGIYLGEGRFIHAPKPGASVRIESTSTRYWRARFNGARRLTPPNQ